MSDPLVRRSLLRSAADRCRQVNKEIAAVQGDENTDLINRGKLDALYETVVDVIEELEVVAHSEGERTR